MHRSLLHTDSFTHRSFYTETPLHTDAFTHKLTHRATQSSRGVKSGDSTERSQVPHQVQRLPRRAVEASKRPKASAVSTQSQQAPRLPCKAAAASKRPNASVDSTEAPSAAPSAACHAKQPRRQSVQTRPGALQRGAKGRASHAKQPRRQSVQTCPWTLQRRQVTHQVPPATQSSRGVKASKHVRGLYREAPSKGRACHAKQPGRQSVQTRPETLRRGTKCRLPRKAAVASKRLNTSEGLTEKRHQAPRLPCKAAAGVRAPGFHRLCRESPSAAPAT